MYEALVARVRYHIQKAKFMGLKEAESTLLLNEAADAIEEMQTGEKRFLHNISALEMENENLKLARRWIPVTERLPEEDGWYQVYAPSYSGGSSSGLKNIKGNMYSAFKNMKWSIEVGYHKRPGCVKAWMPLPEPPEEET